MQKFVDILAQIASALGQANVAAPIIISTISTIVTEIRAHHAAAGEPDPFDGLTNGQIIDQLETHLRANVNFGDEEIARLKAKLEAAASPPAE